LARRNDKVEKTPKRQNVNDKKNDSDAWAGKPGLGIASPPL
jgi:hypothetical protein